jgi:hypothetical protein
MEHPHKDALQQAVDIIEGAKEQVNDLLNPVLPNIALGADSRLKQLTGYLSGVGGLGVNTSATGNAFPTLAEAAQEAGIDIRARKQVVAADTEATNDALELFRAAVDNLVASFPLMTDDNILHGLNMPGMPKVLRGVAKVAGLEDFKEAEINVLFVGRIREALEKQTEIDAKQEALRIQEEDGTTDPEDDGALTITNSNPAAPTPPTPTEPAPTEPATGAGAAETKPSGKAKK